MPDSSAELEARRAAVQLQIAQLGDMRSGSITGTGGRCGNSNCHCHQAGDPGHGPYLQADSQGEWEDRDRDVFLSGEFGQGAARGCRMPAFP